MGLIRAHTRRSSILQLAVKVVEIGNLPQIGNLPIVLVSLTHTLLLMHIYKTIPFPLFLTLPFPSHAQCQEFQTMTRKNPNPTIFWSRGNTFAWPSCGG